MEILDRLKRVEYKIDGLTPDGSSILPAHGTLPAGEFPIPVPLVEDEEDPESVPSGSKTVRSSGGYQYVSSVSKMLEWPVIQQLLDTARYETSAPDDGDTTLRSGLYDSETPLPDDTVHPDDLSGRHSHHMSQQYGGSGPETRLPPPVINWETIQRLSKAYFDTFNLLYPILDRHNFNSSVANVVVKHGLPKSTGSTILLLVLALGDVAVAASGVPVSVRDGRPSGIKGGTADRPPGLVFFNEARKRMGFVLTEVTLENVQMFALAALYYESCGHSKVSLPSRSATLTYNLVGVLANDDVCLDGLPSTHGEVRKSYSCLLSSVPPLLANAQAVSPMSFKNLITTSFAESSGTALS